jgi:predicted dinucleotide-binding enzyme
VRDADVVVLAVLWQHVPRVLRSAGSLRGKVLIDCTNPLDASDDALAVGIGSPAPRSSRGVRAARMS